MTVLLIDENGVNLGQKEKSHALSIAESKGFKLVEVSPQAKPFPVCRLISGKQLYLDKNKRKERSKIEIMEKEYRIKHNISQHDLRYRINQIDKYLDRNYRIKLVILYKFNYEKAAALIHSMHEALLESNPTRKIHMSKPEAKGENVIYCYFKLLQD
ncbi:uncharacterized protein TRIADDRAFT_61382 [Trichoplax adhaerens]|uniref:Translation initiation factor 3 N-terminal domain-containing protein n=1 Tax=Trichoplax adhaerens TaxID=10228 RepID=B3SAU4_TRIAD|nr:hypothetical protein TRIADDRAFT_61382 [Trichoplax adhaerens]EDV20215.1 hypothetical protein TRIADDRAFT_61382 [Trichoplax adhaerens]|eukprot:XP_002117376.1 hypothetical protein TRIADDRAFT_61382 [Trichoplax adhaerens]